MFKDIVVRRYLISLGGKSNTFITVIGERDKVDSYVAEKFGVSNISSSEDIDGLPIIHPDLTTEPIVSNMLNKIYYI